MVKRPFKIKNPSCGICLERPYLETGMEGANPHSRGGLFVFHHTNTNFMIKKLDKRGVVVVGVLIFAITMFLTGHFIFSSFIIFFLMLILIRNEQKKKINKTKEELEEKLNKDKKYFPFILVGILVFFAIVVSNIDGDTSSNKSTTSGDKKVISTEEKQKAWKNFVDSLNLMKEGGIISSYDFSETANVIYVSTGWYTMPVQQKKDFLTSLSSMKEVATGYHRFEVRDAYSNELVAEVKGFSGSIEVYK